MSSPVMYEKKYELYPKKMICANCNLILLPKVYSGDDNLIHVICQNCSFVYVHCPACKKLSSYLSVQGEHNIPCDHCGHALVHIGVSFLTKITPEENRKLLMRKKVHDLYKDPVSIIISDVPSNTQILPDDKKSNEGIIITNVVGRKWWQFWK